MRLTYVLTAVLIFTLTLVLSGCSTAPKSEASKAELHDKTADAITRFKSTDSSMQEFFDSSVGYAVFPSVGKGAVGVGGAYGKGELYEDGMMIGYCDLSQGSIGFQLGGQVYSEIIFFQTESALSDFKNGNLEFSAQASAVAATAGASADAAYEGGVAVFTMTKGGLMYEASIGGQKFSYEPK